MNKRDLEELMKLVPSGTPGGISPDGGSSWGYLKDYMSDLLKEEERKKKLESDYEDAFRKIKDNYGILDLYKELIELLDEV